MARELLVDRVYSHLLTRLAAREIPIGTHLNAQRIAEQLDVSRTSVKFAIARLIDEGWAAPDHGRRPIVRQHPPKRSSNAASTFDFQNQTEQTYETILERIQRGELRPGETLKARRLALELGVNPVTVQRAADWLRNDGLLERKRRRGWRVVKLSLNDLRELYSLRIILEPRMLRKAIRRLDVDILDTLEAEADRISALGEDASAYDRRRADLNFHGTLARCCGNRILRETVEPLIRRAILITTVGFRYGRVGLTFSDHKEILRALRRGDVASAATALQVHLRTSMALNLELWKKSPQSAFQSREQTQVPEAAPQFDQVEAQ